MGDGIPVLSSSKFLKCRMLSKGLKLREESLYLCAVKEFRAIAAFLSPSALVAVGMLVAWCDDPGTAALRELDRRGIPPQAEKLAEVAERGDGETLTLLLTAGVYPDHRDEQGRTPMFRALEREDVALALRLLEAGANPDAAANNEATPLSLAVAHGETVMIDQLLDAGAWPRGRMPDGDDLIPWSVRHGRLLLLDRLFAEGRIDPNQQDHNGMPLVHVALQNGRMKVLDSLLDAGAVPSARDAAGTPLTHAALARGDVELVERLLADGADPRIADAWGRTLFDAALKRDQRQLAELLLEQDPELAAASRLPVVATVIANGWIDLIPAMIQHGADPNRANAEGQTPLELALTLRNTQAIAALARSSAQSNAVEWEDLLSRLCRENDLTMLEALLSSGVPPRLFDEQGRPVVETTLAEGRRELALLFLRYGASPGDALYQACQRDDASAVETLLDGYCSPNPSRSPFLDTPLTAAVRLGHAQIVRDLLDAGALPETPGLERQRPLAVASILGHGKIVGLLLEHNANPSEPVRRPVAPAFLAYGDASMKWMLKHDEQIRPLMLAAYSGDATTLKHLLDHGASRNRYTRYNKRYPINFASQKGHIAAMRLLLGKDPKHEKRRIVIDLSDQLARVFDATGKEIFVTRVSTGKKGYSTPTGKYVITNKYRNWTSTLYHASMPYFQRLSCGDFGMHQGYVPNRPASHGCIRVPAGKANRLFRLTELGDRVEIVE